MTGLEVGFYGKLPSHGDFLRRRVSDGFVGVWDGWLQACLAASRVALGDRWLDVYLTSPAWRFACAAGTCGPEPLVGVMAPSVDRVGRYFPVTLVAEIPRIHGPVAAMTRAAAFFESAERVVIDTLEAEQVDFERFDAEVLGLGELLVPLLEAPPLTLDVAAADMLREDADGAWQVSIGSAAGLGLAFHELLAHRLGRVYEPLILWCSEGSSVIEPSCLATRGVPDPEAFVALLDGTWDARGWRTVPAHHAAPAITDDTLVPDGAALRWRSAAASHVGHVRSVNQDAFIERSDIGVWSVADGLGGLSEGEVASRMVCDALAEIGPEAGFEDMIASARERLQQVNDHLLRAAMRPVNAVRSGSTVVALLARGSRCAALWAGDSRLYRWRAGQLEQVTRDHGLDGLDGPAGGVSHAVTRAVGGEPDLALDVRRDRVRPGDRFLLCSDGLTRTVPDPELSAWLEHDDIRSAVDGLIGAALEAGAPDNVTVLIVEAQAG